MNTKDDLFSGFEGREKKLKAIYRYSMFEVMFYRTNLWIHSQRVSWLVEELTPIAKKTIDGFDAEKARILALVHDDAETITGDVQLGHKFRMSKEELKQVDQQEANAIEQLASQYPKAIGEYNYRDLLYHALNKDCIEAQVVSYADKLDAYCESLHEVLGGNITILRSAIFYEKILGQFPEKYPEPKNLFSDSTSSLTTLEKRSPLNVIRNLYVHLNKPHTPESIKQETDFLAYDEWKGITIERLGEEGVKLLTTQKEFL